jgi:segregation and condensation protein B
VTYGTTEQFLGHFGFDSIQDLPGLSELRAGC